MQSIIILGNGVADTIESERFATLESEVRHITQDVTEIKSSTKTTALAIQSIDKSIAIMTEHVQQNKMLGPRIHLLENKMAKVELKMAVYAGGIAAISFIAFKFDKVLAFFS